MAEGNGQRSINDWMLHIDDKLTKLTSLMIERLDKKADKETVNSLAGKQDTHTKKIYMLIGGAVLLEVVIALAVTVALAVL